MLLEESPERVAVVTERGGLSRPVVFTLVTGISEVSSNLTT